jgi:hypothetical protein
MSSSLREQLDQAASHVPELGDIDRAIAAGMQRRNRTFAVVAAVGMTCVVVLFAVFMSTWRGNPEPQPMQSPKPTPEIGVNGWVTMGHNAAGVYSLDGDRCGTSRRLESCYARWDHGVLIAWMHGGHSSATEVKLHLAVYPEGSSAAPSETSAVGTAVVVAGHEGVYRRIDAHRERWIVDIDGETLVIKLTSRPGPGQADVVEAHTIINSMRTEPANNAMGFRLIFTVPSDDWDSG